MLAFLASVPLPQTRLSSGCSELHGVNVQARLFTSRAPASKEELHHSGNNFSGRWQTITSSALTKLAENRNGTSPNVEKEPHKYFDQVHITVRSGDGGHGAVLSLPRTNIKGPTKKTDKDLYYKQRKMRKEADGTMILPMGGHGGDVVIFASDSEDNLLEYHNKKKHYAKRGGNVDAMGDLTSFIEDGTPAPPLRIPVPVGTVVKRKRGGKFLADLVRPGDKVLVARGGRGGISLVEIPKGNKGHLQPAIKAPTMKDPDDKGRNRHRESFELNKICSTK